MKQIDVREGARRQHRTVALFAVVQCWLRGLDGVAFRRKDLERLLGLDRFKLTRVEWLKSDLQDFFPHQRVYWATGKRNSLSSLIVCRHPISRILPSGAMKAETRLSRVKEGGPKLGMFQLWAVPGRHLNAAFEGFLPFFADRANFDERLLSSFLALLAQGQISPRTLPTLEPEK